MKNSVSINFILRASRRNKNGLAPVYLRITFNGQRIQTTTGIFVEPDKWVAASAHVKGKSEAVRLLNAAIDNKRALVQRFINNLEAEGKELTFGAISDFLNGRTQNHKSLLEVFDYHNNRMEMLVNHEYSPATWKKFLSHRNKVAAFIKHHFNRKDILLSELNFAFITSFDLFLRTAYKLDNNTTVKTIQSLRKIIRLAVQNEWLLRDPFANYKIALIETTPVFLTMNELLSIQNKLISIPRLAQIRDIFIFSCYTGFAYADIAKLSPADITIGIDGEKWIITNRTKTETRSPIPLLPAAIEIIERYKNNPSCISSNKLLPVISNQKTNAFLKEIAVICGINKKLTFHVARHTFATTVTLTNDVPIETVSKMLGHKSIKTTQHYSRVVDSKISKDMKQLKARLSAAKTEQELTTQRKIGS